MTQSLDQYVLVAMLPLTTAALLIAFPWSRRFAIPFRVAALTSMSIALILAFTLVARMLELTQWGDGELSASWLTDAALWSESLRIDRPWILNAVLFVPAGFALAKVARRAWISVAALAALSIAIEFTQRLLMVGAPDPADLVANIVGATLGALIAEGTTRLSCARGR